MERLEFSRYIEHNREWFIENLKLFVKNKYDIALGKIATKYEFSIYLDQAIDDLRDSNAYLEVPDAHTNRKYFLCFAEGLLEKTIRRIFNSSDIANILKDGGTFENNSEVKEVKQKLPEPA